MELRSPGQAKAGDKVAVLSPSFAAPAVAPAVHEQALQRLQAAAVDPAVRRVHDRRRR